MELSVKVGALDGRCIVMVALKAEQPFVWGEGNRSIDYRVRHST